MSGAPLSAQAMRALARELADLQDKPPEGIRVLMNEQDLTDVQAEIEGPQGTPYAGGVFRMRLSLPPDFPASPPRGTFATKIWHPNVSKAGEICVNVLKKDWKPDLGLRHVLLVVRCLLIEPFPESALNEEAGKALLDDYSEYCKYARLMTELHAAPPGAALAVLQRYGIASQVPAAAIAALARTPRPMARAAGSQELMLANSDTAVDAALARSPEPLRPPHRPARGRRRGSGRAGKGPCRAHRLRRHWLASAAISRGIRHRHPHPHRR